MGIKIGKNKSNLSNKEAKEIMNKYKAHLKIPETKPKTQIMICPIGLVGSGKTTVLKPLSKRLSLVRISTDEIRKILKEQGYDYNRVKELAIKLAEKYIKRGYSIAIDADCISKESQRYIKKLKNKYKIKIFWIHINPPEEFIVNKLKNYKHSWLFDNAKQAIQNYKKRKPFHKKLKFPFVYIFDTFRDDLSEQIDSAAGVIKNSQ